MTVFSYLSHEFEQWQQASMPLACSNNMSSFLSLTIAFLRKVHPFFDATIVVSVTEAQERFINVANMRKQLSLQFYRHMACQTEDEASEVLKEIELLIYK